jgi:hypothetical protein
MASEKKPMTPAEQQKIRDIAAATMKETISKSALDAVLNVDMSNLITAEPDPDLAKGKTNGPTCSAHAPGNVELFAVSGRRFVKVANDQGIPGNRIERAQAFVIGGSKILVLKGAPATDLTAIEVKHYKNSPSLWIDCFNVLAKAGLTVETGWQEIYNVVYLPKESPLWPGLMIDFGDRQARLVDPVPKKKSKKKKSEPDGQQKPGPQGSGDQQPATPAPDTNQPATAPAPDQTPETSQQPAE